MTDDLFGNIRPTLSKRDQALARAAGIMAEGRVHRPKSSAQEAVPEEEVTPINIAEAVETTPPAPIPRKPAPAPAERKKPVLSSPEPPRPAKKRSLAAPHWFFQILILLFVLVWVFILGIFIGRGYLMESAPGRGLITWIEEKIGRQPEAPKVSPQISIATPAESAAAEASPPEPAPTPETAPDATIAEPPIVPIVEVEAPEPLANAAPEENAVLRTVADAAQSVGPSAVPAPPDVPAGAPEDEPVFLTPETLAAETPPEPAPAAPTAYIPPPPASLPVAPAAPAGGYAVQATYALSEQAAQAVVDRLRRQGFQAYFYENSRRQYLIRVGRFQSIEEARNAREKLTGLGYKDPYISRLEGDEE